jgi:hypothetical protein
MIWLLAAAVAASGNQRHGQVYTKVSLFLLCMNDSLCLQKLSQQCEARHPLRSVLMLSSRSVITLCVSVTHLVIFQVKAALQRGILRFGVSAGWGNIRQHTWPANKAQQIISCWQRILVLFKASGNDLDGLKWLPS